MTKLILSLMVALVLSSMSGKWQTNPWDPRDESSEEEKRKQKQDDDESENGYSEFR